VLRLNRASGVKTLLDWQGFDSDYNSRSTALEFNLSHDNEGGFLLVCASGSRKPHANLGNLGTIARFNIRRHDLARTFKISAVENVLLHNNVIRNLTFENLTLAGRPVRDYGFFKTNEFVDGLIFTPSTGSLT
jgi:hypothetical protein